MAPRPPNPITQRCPSDAAAVLPLGCTSAVVSSISVLVIGPGVNFHRAISDTAVTSAAVPVMKHPEKLESSFSNVCYREQTGQHLLVVSISAFDPKRTSAWTMGVYLGDGCGRNGHQAE